MMNLVNNDNIGGLSPQKEDRLFFIDNLKVVLTFLVVLHHLVYFSIVYGVLSSSDLGIWNIFMAFNQAFFMGVFFLISGYFVPSSFERHGAARFIKERVIRFLIPLLVYVFALSQIQWIGAYVLTNQPFTWQTYVSHLDYGPMWYVMLLLVFDCLFTLWTKFYKKQAPLRGCKSTPPTYTMLIVFVLLLAATYFIIRLWIPELNLPGGSPMVREIVQLFTASGYDLPQYVGLFIIGIIAFRRNWFRTIPHSMGKIGFGIAIGATLLLLPLALIIGLNGFRFAGGWNWASLVYSLWGALFCVGISVWLITFFRKRIFHRGRLWRFLAGQAYTVYIIHIPIITTIIAIFKVLHVINMFIFPATVVATIPLSFLLANMIRKLPFSLRVLG